MDENGGHLRSEREGGRFTPGWRGGPGRPRGQSLGAELRRQADPEAIAARLLAMIEDPRTNARERLQAIALVFDRLEGKPLTRSITMSADRMLPAGFDAMNTEQRREVLLDLRRRALGGA